jgi:hypothetical protein
MLFTQGALRQRLGDRATLSIRARDPLGLARFSSILDEPTLYQRFERTMGGPEVGFTFTYAVGQRPRQRDREDDRDEQPDTGEVGFQ